MTFGAAASIMAAASSAQAETGDPVSELIVTADRRSQSLSEVGASVDVVDGATLQARGVVSTADLQRLVPGLSTADTGVNFPVYSLRGIGLNDPSLGANSTIAFSVDETPLPYAAMTQGAMLDLERVEVLKGPQGTLYGLNATGGAINHIAEKPTDAVRRGLRIGVSSFATMTGEAYVGGPLGPRLRARLAVGGARGGAWQRSLTRDDSLGEVSRTSARLLLDWRPLDRARFELSLSGWRDASDTPAAQIVAFRPQVAANAGRIADVLSAPVSPPAARVADWTPGRDYGRDDAFGQVSLKTTLSLGEAVGLSAISSYSRYSARALNDRDGMAPVSFQFDAHGDIQSLYQELRLSGAGRRLVWSAGGNYRRDSTWDLQVTDISRASSSYVAGLKLNTVPFFAAQEVETYAAFADGEFAFTRVVSVVAGMRYTRDARDFRGSTCDDGDGETAAVYTVLANTFRARAGLPALAPIAAGECVVLAADTLMPGVVRDRLDEDNLAFRGELKVKLGEGSLVYAGRSRAYKAGSFSTLSAVFSLGYGPATQERVDAIEAGFRTSLFDRRLRLSGAVFHYDYRDKQFRGRILDPVIGSLNKLVNIPRSRIDGVELDLHASPAAGLGVYASAAYVATKVRQFVGVNLFGQIQDFAGQTLPYTPDWSLNAGGRYAWPVGRGLKAELGGDIVYRGRTSGFIGRDRPLDIGAYATLDLRAGLAAADDRWRVTLWAANVTDAYYWTSAMRNVDTINRYAARPATYGLALNLAY